MILVILTMYFPRLKIFRSPETKAPINRKLQKKYCLPTETFLLRYFTFVIFYSNINYTQEVKFLLEKHKRSIWNVITFLDTLRTILGKA